MRKKRTDNSMVIIVAVVVILIVSIVLIAFLSRGLDGDGGDTTPSAGGTPSDSGATDTTGPVISVEKTEFDEISLGQGLFIRDMYKYTGVYMEDGSDDVVTNVMMIVLENTSESDLQLADIALEYADFTATFRATNIPSGEKVVLLEQSRRSITSEKMIGWDVDNVVFFNEPMGLCEDKLEVTGLNGMLNVKNVSGADIDGDVYIYYKYSASDLLYGGITFRTRIEGGLKADELKQIAAGHYTAKGCTIVMVTCGQ